MNKDENEIIKEINTITKYLRNDKKELIHIKLKQLQETIHRNTDNNITLSKKVDILIHNRKYEQVLAKSNCRINLDDIRLLRKYPQDIRFHFSLEEAEKMGKIYDSLNLKENE